METRISIVYGRVSYPSVSVYIIHDDIMSSLGSGIGVVIDHVMETPTHIRIKFTCNIFAYKSKEDLKTSAHTTNLKTMLPVS